jgi:hypothetical protein
MTPARAPRFPSHGLPATRRQDHPGHRRLRQRLHHRRRHPRRRVHGRPLRRGRTPRPPTTHRRGDRRRVPHRPRALTQYSGLKLMPSRSNLHEASDSAASTTVQRIHRRVFHSTHPPCATATAAAVQASSPLHSTTPDAVRTDDHVAEAQRVRGGRCTGPGDTARRHRPPQSGPRSVALSSIMSTVATTAQPRGNNPRMR